MRRTKLSALVVLLLAALALTAAGCGGGGSKNSAATTEAAATEATTTEEATTEEATTEAATTEEATTEAATTTSPIAGLVAGGKCKDLANLGQKYSQALSGAGNSQDLEKSAEVLQEFADEAPSEIKADFQVLADYLTKIVDVVGNLKPGDTPSATQLQKLQELGTSIDTQKLTQASQNITAWVAKNCKA
jgi:hypothetical protein